MINVYELKRGEIIKLSDGKEYVFISMARTKVEITSMDGKNYKAPIAAIKETTGRFDERFVLKFDKWEDLTAGDIISISDTVGTKKETYMFRGTKGTKYLAINLATGRGTRIDPSFKPMKIDLEKMKNMKL